MIIGKNFTELTRIHTQKGIRAAPPGQGVLPIPLDEQTAFVAHSPDAQKERFEAVEILGIPGLFTTERVNRATIPPGMYAYDMQTSEEDWGRPGLLASRIMVEHFGTVLTASPIPLSESGYRDLEPGDFSEFNGAEQMTVAEFEDKYLPPVDNKAHTRAARSVYRAITR